MREISAGKRNVIREMLRWMAMVKLWQQNIEEHQQRRRSGCFGFLTVSLTVVAKLIFLVLHILFSVQSRGSNTFCSGLAIREPDLFTIRTTVACGPFSPSSSLHLTPVPISKRLNSAAGKLFL